MSQFPDTPDCPPPLTEEQLSFFTEQTRRVVLKVQRRWARGAVVGFLILFAGSLGAYQSGQNVAKESRSAIVQSGTAIAVYGCNRDYTFAAAIRGVLISAQKNLEEEHKLGLVDKARYRDSVEFYRAQLKRLTLPDCREAAQILTANPNEVPPVPTPLYNKK